MTAIALRGLPSMESTRAKNHDAAESATWTYGVIAFCLLHIPLALLLHRSGMLSTMHGLVALAVGMWWALTSSERPVRAACAAAYITGSEVLWRMTKSQLFWEYGKYAVAAIFLVAILRSGRVKGPVLMWAFFLLLVPSCLITVADRGPDARGYLSFFMSGPFAMMVAAWFFSQVKLSIEDLRRVLIAACAPILGIAAIAFFGIYTATNIQFTGESNSLTSGDFGPNQVSSVLGMGAMFAFMILVLRKTSPVLKAFVFTLMLFMAAQSALTFSRGGIYNAIGATLLASAYLFKDARTRRNLLLVMVVTVVLGAFVIFPRLESFTGGALGDRFAETTTTNRVEIAEDHLRLWYYFPILGVGPGGTIYYGAQTAHTEFTRFPAEHGTLGIIAVLLLLLAGVNVVRKARTNKAKAVAIFLVGWGLLYMANAAMRLVAPSFVFGLGFATIGSETDPLLLRWLVMRLKMKIAQRRLRQTSFKPVVNQAS